MKNHPLLTKATTAIAAILIVLIVAMIKNIDGMLLSAGIAIIAGLGGYTAGKVKKP